MFIVVGILSILAGSFVFRQASALSALARLAGTSSSIVGSFGLAAIALIVGGACVLASKNGDKRGFVKASAWAYGIGSVAAVANFGVGDMSLWAIVCAGLLVGFIAWLRKHPANA